MWAAEQKPLSRLWGCEVLTHRQVVVQSIVDALPIACQTVENERILITTNHFPSV